MENYKETIQYSYLNVAFKIFIVLFLILFVIFYFKIDIFNIRFFKSNDHKDKKYIYKDFNVNRKLINAYDKEINKDKTLSDFFIKSAFNCCLMKNGISDVVRLKTIISQGFRCLDFKLIYKNNTLHIENQSKNQTFYNALEIIDSHCFSNSFCNNSNDPVIINIRLHDQDINSLQLSKSVYNKLQEMFRALNSNKILDTKYSLLEKIKNPSGYNNILNATLSDLRGKIIVMCNYDYNTIEANYLNANHDVMQYIHFNTYILKINNNYTELVNNLSTEKTMNNLIISQRIHDNFDDNEIEKLITNNMTYPCMIIPSDNIPVASLFDEFGYTFRALNFANIDDFNNIIDPETKIYNDEFNIVSSAFILKPINKRLNL